MHGFRRAAGILAALLAVTSGPVAAQSVLAFRVGPSLGKFSGFEADRYTTRTALDVGASIAMPLTRWLGLQLGAAYVEKGATRKYATEIVLDYVQLPVLLQIGATSKRGASLLVGPAVSFKAKCQVLIRSVSPPLKATCPQWDIDPRGVDFGLVGGFQLQTTASRHVLLMLDALYDMSFMSFQQSGESQRNRTFTVRAGFGVPVG